MLLWFFLRFKELQVGKNCKTRDEMQNAIENNIRITLFFMGIIKKIHSFLFDRIKKNSFFLNEEIIVFVFYLGKLYGRFSLLYFHYIFILFFLDP
jgi:hypothetical protein